MTGSSGAHVLAEKRRQGAVVYGEVLAAALATDGGQCSKGSWSHGAAYVVSPPLRSDPETPDVLMDLLVRWTIQFHLFAPSHKHNQLMEKSRPFQK